MTIMPTPPPSSILTRTSFSFCSKAAMWDSKISILPLLPRMAISCPVRARWAGFGNGLARCWIGMGDLNQWNYILVIQVCLLPHAGPHNPLPSRPSPKLKLYVLAQRTSSTENIISFWVGRGRPTLGLRGGRHCESIYKYL